MKRIFSAIGLLLMFFSFSLYFMLTEESIFFLCYDDVYIINLDEEYMSIQEMEEIAVDNNVMLTNRQIIARGIGNGYAKHRVINPRDDIKEGIEHNIFGIGKKEIEFIDSSDKENFRQILVYTNNKQDFDNVIKAIKNKGYDISTHKMQEIKWTIVGMVSETFLIFYILVGILSVIAIVSYYVYRLKEIGILRLNGWSNKKISNKIMMVMIKQTLIYFLVPIGIIAIYVLVADYHLLRNLIFISFYVLLFQLAIYYISNFIASILISKINCTSAIKNKKNNTAFFCFLLLAKLVTVLLLLIQINSMYKEIIYLNDINKADKRLQECNLYTLEQREPLGEKYQELIVKQMEAIPDSEIYNYYEDEEGYLFSSAEIAELKKNGSIKDYNNIITCSYNFLPMLKVKDVYGRYINNVKIDELEDASTCVLLIPEHYANEIEDIKKALYIDVNYDKFKYYFIEDNQVYNNYNSQDSFSYDCIIDLSPLYKEISGSVILTKEGKEILDNILDSNGISRHTVYARSLVEDNNEWKATVQLQLFRNTIYMVLAIMSYIIVTFSIITIYFEIKKKRIGVYMLQGKYPKVDIMVLLIINILIVTGFAIKLNKTFLYVNIIEIVMYICLLYKYLKNKAILAIKGE